jgi:hypothetical protein
LAFRVARAVRVGCALRWDAKILRLSGRALRKWDGILLVAKDCAFGGALWTGYQRGALEGARRGTFDWLLKGCLGRGLQRNF